MIWEGGVPSRCRCVHLPSDFFAGYALVFSSQRRILGRFFRGKNMNKFSRILFVGLLLLTVSVLRAAESAEEASALYSEGIHHFFNGQYGEAEKEFTKASNLQTSHPAYYFFIGLCRYRAGNLSGAEEAYRLGAVAELTKSGRSVDVGSHLRRIQGEERVFLERIRKEIQDSWNEREALRREALYGKAADRNKAQLTTVFSEVPQAAVSARNLPLVNSIRPTDSEEMDATESEALKDHFASDGTFTILADEVGRRGLTTREQKRREAIREKSFYGDPSMRPAADGSRFIDIYGEKEVYADGQPFYDPEHPEFTVDDEGNPFVPEQRAEMKDSVITGALGNLLDNADQMKAAPTGNANISGSEGLFNHSEVENPFDQSGSTHSLDTIKPFESKLPDQDEEE